MVLAVFGVKGGVGVSTVSALLAASLGVPDGGSVLLVDLAGAQPSLCGVEQELTQGVTEWAHALPDVPDDAVHRLGWPVRRNLTLLCRGSAQPSAAAADEVVARLHEWAGPVIIDGGLLSGSPSPSVDQAFRTAVVSACDVRVLVTRACYLGLLAVASGRIEPTASVLLSEPGRALTTADVESVTGAPVSVEIAVDPSIARLVDSGLLVDRVPRRLERCLERAFGSSAPGHSRV